MVWNHDKGHQVGNDKSLILKAQAWEVYPVLDGYNTGPSTTLTSISPLTIPGNGTVSTITFTFNQSYDKFDNSEEMLINLSTPGCVGFPIHATH